MHKLAFIFGCWLLLLPAGTRAGGRPVSPEDFRQALNAGVHTSLSGQFVVRQSSSPGYSIPLGNAPNVHYVRVDPTLLTITCERIKSALLTEIGASDQWQDKIYFELHPARSLDETVIVSVNPYDRYWSYHISLPDTIERTRLITTVVEVLLVEMANRHSDRSAEIPPWLAYGICQDVMQSSHIELVLEPAPPLAVGLNISLLTVVGTNTNSLSFAHDTLHSLPPLTFEQLTWPDDAQLAGEAGEAFRSSAQLFVHDLLRLKDGRAGMRAFIQELPRRLNWQLSFLHAFRSDFPSQLELEKWWALHLVDFTGRDLTQTWNIQDSWKKLTEAIRPQVEIRTRADEMPLRTEVPLQAIIRDWDVARQVGLLRDKDQQLFQIRARVSQHLVKLVDDYRKAIESYLSKRAREGYLRNARSQAVMGLDRVAREAIAELDVLDDIREDLRPKPEAVQSANASVSGNR